MKQVIASKNTLIALLSFIIIAGIVSGGLFVFLNHRYDNHLRMKGFGDYAPPLQLTQELMELTLTAATLSKEVFFPGEWATGKNVTSNQVIYKHPEFPDMFQFYTEDPDAVLLAQKYGRCFVAFRRDSRQISDWLQNFNLHNKDVYKDNGFSEKCSTRAGFADFLYEPVAIEALADIHDCMNTCEDPDNCLILTGFSQGAANAAVASIALHSLNPMLITFGQPPTFVRGCRLLPERYYRYVNSMEIRENDLQFDLVPNAPTLISGSQQYGHGILLGEDSTSVYYMGYNEKGTLVPPQFSQDLGYKAHNMGLFDEKYGYLNRIAVLVNNFAETNSKNITTTGFSEGALCENYANEICESKVCANFQCAAEGGVKDTCIEQSCDNDDDCAGDWVCIRNSCAISATEVEDGCPCRWSSQCSSGKCQWGNVMCADENIYDKMRENDNGIANSEDTNVNQTTGLRG